MNAPDTVGTASAVGARVTLVSPRLDPPAAPVLNMAPRLEALTGAKLAILSNGKPNADAIARAVVAQLRQITEFDEVLWHTKNDPSIPTTGDELTRLARHADAIIAAVGDCGSCSSCLVSDSLELERLGVPVAVVLTTPFAQVATAIGTLRGFPEFRAVEFPHPVADLDAATIRSFAADAAAQVRSVLVPSAMGGFSEAALSR